MAIKKKQSFEDWWSGTLMRLVASYADLNKTVHHKAIMVPLCPLNISYDDFSLSINGKRQLFHEDAFGGDKLISYMMKHKDVSPCLFFEDNGENTPFMSIRSSDDPRNSVLLSLVTDPSDTRGMFTELSDYPDETLQLSPVFDDAFLEAAKANFAVVNQAYEKEYKAELKAIYDAVKVRREDEVVFKLSEKIVSGESVSPESLYRSLLLFSGEEVNSVRDSVFVEVQDFYRDLYEHGEFSSKEEVEASVAFASKTLEDYFSFENLLFGRLSHQVSNFGIARGEVSGDDIAMVAFMAEKNPSYAPYLGTKLDSWIERESAAYGISVEAVQKKRISLGASKELKPRTPALSAGAKQLAKKRFGLGV